MVKSAGKDRVILAVLDRTRAEPLFEQLASELRMSIQNGALPPKSRLPSIRTISTELGVSKNTVIQAFDVLAGEGYLTGRIGAGTYVANIIPDDNLIYQHAPSGPEMRIRDIPKMTLSTRGVQMIASAIESPTEQPIPFMPDVPDLREFPMRTWLRIMGEATGRLRSDLLANVSNAGFDRLRQAIAQHISVARGVRCSWEQVIVTTGSQQSLDLICRLLLDRGDPVWMEDPGYIGAQSAFRGGGAEIYPIPVDEHGMAISKVPSTHPLPKLIFACPSRQYPLGSTLSPTRREELMDFADTCGSWIVEDDYDCEYRYDGLATGALQGVNPYRVVYMGTFSKTCVPSFRLGYLVVPEAFASAFATTRAMIDRHAPIMEQLALAEYIEHGHFAAHLRRMRELYRKRQDQLIQSVADASAGQVRLPSLATGTNAILWLKPGKSDTAATRIALEHGIVVRPISLYHAKSAMRSGLMLGYAAFTESEMKRAAENFFAALPPEKWFDPDQT
ncbi:MAG: PLP-dependent aminotransferase family protein [Pseudomonadota bacterium]